MAPHIPKPNSENERLKKVEKALDAALDETFPASDAVNLHQWAELMHEEQDQSEQDDDEQADRTARYLKGPTAFSA